MQEILQDLNVQLRRLLIPKDVFSWQTLLLLSLFSLFVAVAVDSTTQNPSLTLDSAADNSSLAVDLLTTLSWLFFTFAVWWALSDTKALEVNGFSLSPWVTGAVWCLFLFRPWLSDLRLRWAISSWPLISTGVKALPYFVNWELKFKLPKAQVQNVLIMTLLINLLLSSWFVFNFRIQDWVRSYPSLLFSSLAESDFVVDFRSDREQPSQGRALLEGMISEIEADLVGQPWYQTERWLYTRKSHLEAALQKTLESLDAPAEEIFWQVESPDPTQSDQAYLLTLRAIWSGPMAREGAFDLEKICKIQPVDVPRAVPAEADEPQPVTKVTAVDCGEDAPQERLRGTQTS